MKLKRCCFDTFPVTAITVYTQMAGLELGYMESKNRPSLVTMKTISSKCNKLKQEGTVFRNSPCIVVEVCTKLNFYCFCLSV